ncbi:hypothetical protein PRIPAC_85531, partial [Pristionchus pacificus]|uniref:Uncharacterized protein n=1 Tax=Pristionchus pacificus TaxID=54126 RepID=A0A2A6BKE0_PRIPA
MIFHVHFIYFLCLPTFVDASLSEWFGNITELPTKYATAAGEVVCHKGPATVKVPGIEVNLKAGGWLPRKKFESTAATDVDGRFNLTSVMQAKWRHNFKIHIQIACSDDHAMKVVTDRCPDFFKSLECSKICKLVLEEEIPDTELYDSPAKS